MIPSVLALQLKHGVEDFLRTTFPMSTPLFHGMLERFLEAPGGVFKGPYLSIQLPFRQGSEDRSYFADVPTEHPPCLHRERAFRRLGGPRPRSTIVATGTSSGKTECFLYPILDHCLRHRGTPGNKSILIYPMNAPANDQAARLAGMIHGNQKLRGQVTAGLYVGQSEKEPFEDMGPAHIISRKETLRDHPPDILLTNYKMLDYLAGQFRLWFGEPVGGEAATGDEWRIELGRRLQNHLFFQNLVLQSSKEALACFLENTDGKLCVNAAEQIVPYLLDDVERRPAAAYCLAWLQVAGGNSVLPPWVRHRFSEIPTIIKALREAPCGQTDCAYCLENHDPERQLEQTHELIVSHLHGHSEPGGVIVYAATKKSTEEIQEFLQHQGVLAEVFHGGLDPGAKREIIERFVVGDVPVICATNAFGMGIDKENIRLVLHYNMPGSLENYIQEAGRAGRDSEPARCVLLYDPQDANLQFSMGAMSEVKRKEIARILRALRRKKKNAYGEIVVTSDELLREEDWAEMQALRPEYRDTKIRAAVAWLERAGFLERNHNQAEVFQGKPLVESIEEAAAVMEWNRNAESFLWA
jgi:hypothetical protein